jgi:hypothetical protein
MTTQQSIAAKAGNLAERLLCDSRSVFDAFQPYFNKQIVSIKMVGGRKKSDICIQFIDSITIKIQNKNGNIGGRGHSVNRCSVSNMSDNESVRSLLQEVCISKKGDIRQIVHKEESAVIVNRCLFGNLEFRPDYFTHTKIVNGQIVELSICPTSTLHAAVLADLYDTILPKKTCVHLSPSIYLQRKGGGKKDHAPDDIQMKFRLEPYINLFTRIL